MGFILFYFILLVLFINVKINKSHDLLKLKL